jgi:hypothetical protein
LPCDETDHAEGNIFGSVGSVLSIFDYVQALAFEAKVNVLAVDERNENNIEATQFFVVCWLQFDELRVDLKREISRSAMAPDYLAEGIRDVVLFLVRRRLGHLLPTGYDET